MSVLLLRLAGPMQSWGTQSRFTMRDTGMEASKSGVLGLLCAALGRHRQEPVDDLAVLRMGVRVDREGVMKRDYQTVGGGRLNGQPYGVATAGGGWKETAVLSNRYYLSDADFLVALEGNDYDLLQQLQDALAAPHWPLFLGRKAFVPGVPVYLPERGLRPGAKLEDALWGPEALPWPRWDLGVPQPDRRPSSLRVVLETSNPTEGEARLDQPYGNAFDLDVRRVRPQFVPRYVKTDFKELGAGPDRVPVRPSTPPGGKPCT